MHSAQPSRGQAPAGTIHDIGHLIQVALSAVTIVARTPDMPLVHAGPMLHRAQNCLDHAARLVRGFEQTEIAGKPGLLSIDGKGIALLIDRFVGEAGGEISISSEPGVGTTVILRLPANHPK